MSDQSRFTTADAALERNPLTTPAMATRREPVKTQEPNHPGENPSARSSVGQLTRRVRGRGGRSARAEEERGHQQRRHRRAPTPGRHWPQRDSQQVGRKLAAAEDSEGAGGGHLGRRRGEEAGSAQIEDGECEKPPGIRAFLALREGREGEKQVGGKRQAMLCSLAAAAAARLLALADFVGF